MAAPLISSAKGYNASATSIGVNSADLLLSGGGAGVPVSGDYLLFFCSTDTGTATITPPGGLTAFGAQLNTDGAMNARAWYLALSGSPATTYTFTHDGVAGPFRLDVVCVKPNGNTFSAIAVSQVDTAGATSLASTGVTGGADERVLVIHWVNDGFASTTPDPSGMTLLQSQESDAFVGHTWMQTGVATGSQSRTMTYGGSESIAAFAAILSYTAAAAGPTIDTQPTAQTCTINNSTDTTATFTVAATTSGGALSYQWQLEDSVGAGTYTNISNGGIYSGATSTSLVVTPTTKTGLTGLRVRCNVTDSNGTTATNAVVLTVYTGFQFTSATDAVTDGSGEATVTWTDDRPGSVLGNGGFVKGIATSGTVVSRTSQRPT